MGFLQSTASAGPEAFLDRFRAAPRQWKPWKWHNLRRCFAITSDFHLNDEEAVRFWVKGEDAMTTEEIRIPRKQWQHPELVILVRARPEAVLSTCKSAGSPGGSQTHLNNCTSGSSNTCGGCNIPTVS
jgi:hypothetical protein